MKEEKKIYRSVKKKKLFISLMFVTFLLVIFVYAYTIQENVAPTGTLINITSEGNFTHLNISGTHPYDDLIGYWNFDGDKEDTILTTHYDWSKYNNDGTGRGNTYVNSTGINCLFGNCGSFDTNDDWIDC